MMTKARGGIGHYFCKLQFLQSGLRKTDFMDKVNVREPCLCCTKIIINVLKHSMGIISSNRFELLSEVAAVQYENPDSWGLFEKSLCELMCVSKISSFHLDKKCVAIYYLLRWPPLPNDPKCVTQYFETLRYLWSESPAASASASMLTLTYLWSIVKKMSL